jgi:hypothetical protein
MLNEGVIAVSFANNTEMPKCSVKECRVIAILKQTVYAVYSNYSSNRVKCLSSTPAPRSTGLWTERIIKEWTSSKERRRSPCFRGKKKNFHKFAFFPMLRTASGGGPSVAVT